MKGGIYIRRYLDSVSRYIYCLGGNKMKRKILSVVFMLLLCISMFPMTVMADTDINAIDVSVNGFKYGNKVSDVTVKLNVPTEGLLGLDYSFCHQNPAGTWTECNKDHVFDARKSYAIRIFMHPQAGYSTAGLVKDNVKVNGEVSTYFYNPCDGVIPPGYPEGKTLKIFHYFPTDPTRKSVPWSFDLDGGAAPSSDPDVFNPFHTIYDYKYGDTIEVEEFFRKVGKEPVRTGYKFKGWKCSLLDGNNVNNVLKEFDGFYDFGGVDGIPLSVESPSGRYELKFKAVWEAEGAQAIKKLDISVTNFKEGMTFGDMHFISLINPIYSADLKRFYLCYYTPSGEKKRIAFGDYVIDGMYNYWIELFFVPRKGFYANDLKNDDVKVDIDGFMPEIKELVYPCPEQVIPDGLPENTFAVMIKPFNSMLDREKWHVMWDFDLDGGKEPVLNIFSPRKSAYLYKHGDKVVPEEFEYFKGIKPERSGYTFKGWTYKLCECRFGDNELGIPSPMGKYVHSEVAFDADAGIPLDEKLTGLPGTDFPYLYYIKFKAVWEKDGTPGDTPDITPGTPGNTQGTPGKVCGTKRVPKTGDENGTVFALFGVQVVLLGLVLILYKIKRDNRR